MQCFAEKQQVQTFSKRSSIWRDAHIGSVNNCKRRCSEVFVKIPTTVTDSSPSISFLRIICLSQLSQSCRAADLWEAARTSMGWGLAQQSYIDGNGSQHVNQVRMALIVV